MTVSFLHLKTKLYDDSIRCLSALVVLVMDTFFGIDVSQIFRAAEMYPLAFLQWRRAAAQGR